MRVTAWPVLFLLSSSLCVFAQKKHVAPAKVDQALRARVSQYMQFTVDHAFSKAYALVADESKDWFLSSGKSQYTKYKIQGIEYSQDLHQAQVKTEVTRVFSMQGHDIPSDVVVTDIWKLENGKWMYYHDPDLFSTPFGDVKIDHNAKSHAESVPKDVGPEAEAKVAAGLRPEVSTDKAEMVFVTGTASSDQIVLHNGLIGKVDIEADVVGDYGAFSVEPSRIEIGANKDVVLKISYKPLDRVIETNLRVRVQPFGHVLLVPLRLKALAASSEAGH